MAEETGNKVPKLAHRLFLFACVFTWPLLFVGGLVTTYRVGMAVPDWPTTFGINMFLFNFLNAAWGVFIEHGHRLYGSAVGFCLLVVAPWVQLLPNVPKRFKIGAWVALLGVIIQGVMGGLRVTRISTELAMVHGCFAQLFFAYLACLTAFSSSTRERLANSHSLNLSIITYRIGTILPLLVYAQTIAGAWLRHFQSPDKLYIHSILGLTVVVSATILGVSVRRDGLTTDRSIRKTKSVLVGLCHLQWLLGVLSWWTLRPFDGIAKPVTDFQAIVRTAHQANGALVLAFASVMALWLVQVKSARRQPSTQSQAKMEAVCLS